MRSIRWKDPKRKGPKKGGRPRLPWGTTRRAQGASPWARAGDRRCEQNQAQREAEDARHPRKTWRWSWATLVTVAVAFGVLAVLAVGGILQVAHPHPAPVAVAAACIILGIGAATLGVLRGQRQ